jgi:hypothetical protein
LTDRLPVFQSVAIGFGDRAVRFETTFKAL